MHKGSASSFGLEDQKVQGKRKSRDRCLLVVTIFLFIAVVALAVLLAVYFITKDDDDDDKKVCTTRNCVVTASKLAEKMDVNADPCQNFAQYACGGFYRDTTIADDRNKVTSFTVIDDKNAQVLRIIMEEDIKPEDTEHAKKMKTYYQNCMDEDRIEELGLAPYKSSPFAQDWPTLNPAWVSTGLNLNDLITKYETVFVEPLFVYSVNIDLEDSNKRQLHLAQPGLGLPIKYMKLPRNDTVVMAYQQYYEDIAVELGADSVIARQDAKDIVDFERELANIMVTREESININTLNNPTTLRNMSVDFPGIDFHRAVQSAFDSIDMTISEDLVINDRHPKYFGKLMDLLDAADKRVIMNLFGFRYARMYVGSLTKRLRDIRMKLVEAMTGNKKADPRWRQCLSAASGFIGDAVAKTFVKETFTEDSKKFMDTMIVNLKAAFGGLLKANDWMEAKTKKAAFLKLNHMRQKIGYPDVNFSDDFINTKYENYTIQVGEHYKTYVSAFRQKNMDWLRNLEKDVDKERWLMQPYEVNAYYSSLMNEIGFPAGILQPPYFSSQAPSSVNYGAIGSIIGHEITHGFDQSGSQMDYQGNLKNWWQPDDLSEFKNRTQCIIDHYANFELEEISMKLNGKLTAGENTADIGGLKESYIAYKTYSAKQPKELPLPGLGLTTDQQFYLAYAQLWCSKRTDGASRKAVLNGIHSPGRFRIIGALQNNDGFSSVFKCPVGSPMNPAKKCVVW